MEWKASELDNRCSEACVRAGLATLLFSALAISLLQPLIKQKAVDALDNYIALRLTLKYTLDELDRTECWQELNHSEAGILAPNKWTIAKLVEHRCTYRQRELEAKPEPTAPSDPALSGKLRRIPRVPLESAEFFWEPITPNIPLREDNLRLGLRFPLYHAEIIADILTELGNGDLLRLARSASTHFNYAIHRWTDLRELLLAQNREQPLKPNAIAFNVIDTFERGIENYRSNYERSYSREELLRDLTLEDVRELTSHELPTISQTERPIIEEKHFTLSPTAPPLTIISAPAFVNLVILFSLAYFMFFQHEARRSDTFLAPGTLFGVLNRTKTSRYTFILLIVTPAASTISLTWFSSDLLLYTPSPRSLSDLIVAGLNIVITLLVLLFTWRIARAGGFSMKGLLQGFGRLDLKVLGRVKR